jgi:L-seryl-tRNA(Ser) seleniumtransferase
MNPHHHNLRNFPAVDKILNQPEIKNLISVHNTELVTYVVRQVLDQKKKEVLKEGGQLPTISEVIAGTNDGISQIILPSLVNVINATGVIIHTNLGRAPFSPELFNEAAEILTGYNNLEFNLKTSKRGSRYTHVGSLLRFLTGAEDVLVVNNNAAAVMMILQTFAKNKEVIVSRGELIEIGGSFRLPEIFAASDCKMVEVGTTNKTRISDYELAINDETAVLFKAHTSNYTIEGFTEEASLKEMVSLGKKYNLPVVYDMGSGLFNKSSIEILSEEPVVKEKLVLGIDLVSFSADKLLGGPQAGIIAGKAAMIAKLKKQPILRALRVDKITLAFLESTCMNYLNEEILFTKNRVFEMLNRSKEELMNRAEILKNRLGDFEIISEIVENSAKSGGGSLPGKEIDSYAIKLTGPSGSNKLRSAFAEKMHYGLLAQKTPVLSILRKGNLYFDVLTLADKEIEKTAQIIHEVYRRINQ